MIAVASLLQLLILAGALYDTARLLKPATDHRVSRARRRRAALEAAERRLVGQRLRGRIDAAAYRDVVFTVEYSVRGAMHAVYGLLGIDDHEIPGICHALADPRTALDVLKAALA